ncbi:major facilitator transporter [Brevibacillus panacihumi W25]|uniref:Major facilitator transporter n=1 Tax=Brevibacillus panacihumi W25 TaxID=1408254 RepID=V6M5H5_9BACL|nr:MDR family MFS transporter [Brevibacillus panacihumi]EST53547.1 major facilitator transporter [Brevibacillus panacihumi W25]
MDTSRTSFWPIMIAVFFGAFLSVLNTSTINVAIPSLMNSFDSDLSTMQWTLTGFMLATGLSAPLSGFLGDRFSNKRLYLYVLIGLALTSLLCAVAWSPIALIFFRMMQGFFCGIIMPTTMTIIYQTVHREKQAFAVSLWSIAAWMGPAFGPTIAGLILQYLSWQWLFLINVPLAILSIILAVRLIPHQQPSSQASLDISGLIMVLYCSFALLIAFSEGGNWGWGAWQTLVFMGSGFMILYLFVRRESRTPEPLLHLSVFHNNRFMISVVLSCIINASLYAGVYLVPLFMQTIQQVSPLQTGLTLLPASAVMAVVMPIIGKMYNRVGAFWLTVIGMLIMAYSQWQMNLLSVEVSSGYIMLWMMVRNIGIAFTSAPLTNAGMEEIPEKLYGHASAVSNWTRSGVSALAIGLFTTLLAWRQAIHVDALPEHGVGASENLVKNAMTAGVNDVFLLSGMLIVVSLPLTLVLRKKASVKKGKTPPFNRIESMKA